MCIIYLFSTIRQVVIFNNILIIGYPLKYTRGDLMNNVVDYNKIGTRIKKARNDKGITQAKICNDLNISFYNFSKIENAYVSDTLETLVEISNHLDISLEHLFSGTSKLYKQYLDDKLSNIVSNCDTNQKKLILEFAKLISNTEIKSVHIK